MGILSAPSAAKLYLRDASHSLGAADPSQVREVSNALDDWLTLPLGDPTYSRQPPLKSSFAEERAGHLDFTLTPVGASTSPADRTYAATQAMEDIVGHHYGPNALRWLKGHLEPVVARGRTIRWGAQLASSFDRNGVRETMVTYEWGPDLLESFPEPLYRLARLATDTVPGARPAYSAVRCGRTSGSQQLTFVVESPLSLNGLRPLLDALGLGEKHAALMSAVAFVLGARFTLPPNCCSITLRPLRAGAEFRLDVNLELIPDLPPQLMSLLRMQLAERPQNLRAMDNWLVAMTPEGYETPGTLSILSFAVRPDMMPRINLHIRPPIIEQQPETPPTVVADGTSLPATTSALYTYNR